MDTHYDLLGQLRREWCRLGHSAGAQRATRDFVARHGELPLEGVVDLGDVLQLLERRGGKTVEERAAILQGMLEDAGDPLIHRALLQTLLPGIVSVCRQLQFGRGVVTEPSEALDEAISMASELLVDWAGQSRPYAGPDVLSALRGRLRRWLLKEKAARLATVDVDTDTVSGRESSTLITRLASYCNGPHERIARLTYARVFEGRPLRELATRDHSSPRALQLELQQFATKFLL